MTRRLTFALVLGVLAGLALFCSETPTGTTEQDIQVPAAPANVETPVRSGDSIVIVWDAAERAGSYKVYRMVGEQGDFVLVATVDGESYTDTALTAASKFSYYVVAVNSIGTSEASQTRVVILPNRSPRFDPRADTTINGAEGIVVTITASDPDGIVPEVVAVSIPAGVTFADNSLTWYPSTSQTGAFTLVFAAGDNSLSDTLAMKITVNHPPVMVPIGNRSVALGDTLRISLSAADPEGGDVFFTAANAPRGSSLQGSSFTFVPTVDSSYTVTFLAHDEVFRSSQTILISAGNVNRPPRLTVSATVNGTVRQILQFAVTATDTDATIPTVSCIAKPSGAAFSNGTFSWIPPNRGTFYATFTATDGELVDTARVTITIDSITTAGAVVLTLPADTAVEVGRTLLLSVTAVGDNVTITASQMPPGAHFDGAVMAWVPQSAGAFRATFVAADGTTTDTGSVMMTVTDPSQPVGHAPSFAFVANVTVNINSPVRFAVEATDPDGTVPVVSAAAIPLGALFENDTFSWTPSSAGNFQAMFVASDGELVDTLNVYITVGGANRPPTIRGVADTTIRENELLELDFAVSDPEGATLAVVADSLPDGAQLGAGHFTWRPGYSDAGIHTARFSVTDEDLVVTHTLSIVVTNVNRAPQFVTVSPRNGKEGQELSFSVLVSDPDGSVPILSYSPLPEGAVFANAIFIWTPGHAQAGVHQVTFIASDGARADTMTVSMVIEDVNRAPFFDGLQNLSAREGQRLTFTVVAADRDGDEVSVIADRIPAGAAFDTATLAFEWTPTSEQSGNHIARFTASDGELVKTDSVIITVGDVNRPPELAAIGNKQVAENETIEFTLTASDPDGQTLALAADPAGLPSGHAATFTAATGRFSWRPSYTEAGTYQVTFSASDGELSDYETVTIRVTNTNRDPSMTTIRDTTIAESRQLMFAVSVTDPDGDPVSVGATGLPSGARLDDQTNVFTWKPTYSQAGSFAVTFVASDGKDSVTQTVTITVTDVNQAPTLSPLNDVSVAEGQRVSFTVNATDPDGTVPTFTVEGKPTAATFAKVDNNNYQFTWNTTNDDAGSYSLSFIASDGSLSDTRSIAISVGNVNRPPALDPIGNKSVNEMDSLFFDVTATDPDGTPPSLSVDVNALPAGATFDATTGHFGWRPGYSAGDQGYTITFTASDGTLTDEETITITVVDVPRAPSVSVSSPESGSIYEAGAAITITATASDPDNDIDRIEFYNNTSSLLGTDGDGSPWTHTISSAQSGTYQITVKVFDSKGSNATSTAVTISVYAAPAITSQATAQTVMAGQTLTLSAIATGDNLSYQWIKDGVNVGTNSPTYQKTAQPTDHGKYKCVVTNPVGTVTSNEVLVTLQYSLTVNSGGNGTVSPSSATVNHGEATAIRATANAGYDFGGWTTNDNGVSFGDAGSASTTVTLTNGHATVTGNCALKTYTLTVETEGGLVIEHNGAVLIDGTGGIGFATVTVEHGVTITLAAKYGGQYFYTWEVTQNVDNVSVDSSNWSIATITAFGNAAVKALQQPALQDPLMRCDGLIEGWFVDNDGDTGRVSPANWPTGYMMMAQKEVTQAAFRYYMGFNPSANQCDSCPVENVTWYDAVLFCNRNSVRWGMDTMYAYTDKTIDANGNCTFIAGLEVDWGALGFRLPTEDEWERTAHDWREVTGYSMDTSLQKTYGTLAGVVLEGGGRPYANFGNRIGNTERASYFKDTYGQLLNKTMQGNSGYISNEAHGFYDMSGNVWEWTWDRVGGSESDRIDNRYNYTGPASGGSRRLKGGGYDSDETMCRGDYHGGSMDPGSRAPNVGFRVAYFYLL